MQGSSELFLLEIKKKQAQTISLSGWDRLYRGLVSRVALGRRSKAQLQGRCGGREKAFSFLKTSPISWYSEGTDDKSVESGTGGETVTSAGRRADASTRSRKKDSNSPLYQWTN